MPKTTRRPMTEVDAKRWGIPFTTTQAEYVAAHAAKLAKQRKRKPKPAT